MTDLPTSELKKKAPTENSIMKGIMFALSMRGWGVFRMPASVYGKAGLPDLFVSKKGKCAWLEIKGPKGKLSPAQEEYLKRLERAGQTCIVARSVDYVLQVLGENNDKMSEAFNNLHKAKERMREMGEGK